ARVRRGSLGHRQRPGLVDLLLPGQLVLDGETGTAGSAAERAAALDHEVLDHPVERQPVIVGALHLLSRLRIGELFRTSRQTDEIGDCSRRVVLEQLANNFTLVRLEVGSLHQPVLFLISFFLADFPSPGTPASPPRRQRGAPRSRPRAPGRRWLRPDHIRWFGPGVGPDSAISPKSPGTGARAGNRTRRRREK